MMPIGPIVVQALFQYGPDIARLVKEVLTKPDVSSEDIDKLIAAVEAVNFNESRNRAQAQLDAENAAR